MSHIIISFSHCCARTHTEVSISHSFVHTTCEHTHTVTYKCTHKYPLKNHKLIVNISTAIITTKQRKKIATGISCLDFTPNKSKSNFCSSWIVYEQRKSKRFQLQKRGVQQKKIQCLYICTCIFTFVEYLNEIKRRDCYPGKR